MTRASSQTWKRIHRPGPFLENLGIPGWRRAAGFSRQECLAPCRGQAVASLPPIAAGEPLTMVSPSGAGRMPACGPIPIENLFAGPQERILAATNVLNHLAEISEAMWSAHDVGVDNQSHHPRRVPGIVA